MGPHHPSSIFAIPGKLASCARMVLASSRRRQGSCLRAARTKEADASASGTGFCSRDQGWRSGVTGPRGPEGLATRLRSEHLLSSGNDVILYTSTLRLPDISLHRLGGGRPSSLRTQMCTARRSARNGHPRRRWTICADMHTVTRKWACL